MGSLLIAWSIRLALIAMAGSLFIRLSDKSTRRAAAARWLWSVGCALYLVHMVSAFHFAHHWSHDRAQQLVAEQTEAVVGLSIGWGVFFNHLFTAVWIVDCVWWWLGDMAPQFRAPRAWRFSALAFLLFIAINGAIIFENGPVRWFAMVVLVLLIARFANVMRRSQHGLEPRSG